MTARGILCLLRPPGWNPLPIRSVPRDYGIRPVEEGPREKQLSRITFSTSPMPWNVRGMEESQAIATAINAVKRWAQGDLHWGNGKVTPEVQAASQRALDEWEPAEGNTPLNP